MYNHRLSPTTSFFFHVVDLTDLCDNTLFNNLLKFHVHSVMVSFVCSLCLTDFGLKINRIVIPLLFPKTLGLVE